MRSNELRFPGGEATTASEEDLALIGRYLDNDLSPWELLAVEHRLLHESWFYRRAAFPIAMAALPFDRESPDEGAAGANPLAPKRPSPAEAFAIELNAVLAKPSVFSVNALMLRIRRDARADERVGRTWVHAVRRARHWRQLTSDEADALVVSIVDCMRTLTEERAGLLLGLGERRLARAVRANAMVVTRWAAAQLKVLEQRLGRDGRDWSKDYPEWDSRALNVVVPVGGRPEVTDVVLSEIEERLADAEAEGLGPDWRRANAEASAPIEWLRLRAAWERRMGLHGGRRTA